MLTGATRPHTYTLGTNPGERARLQRQADDLASHTLALLDHAGLGPGGRAVREHLAGPGTISLTCLYFLSWGRKPLGTGTA